MLTKTAKQFALNKNYFNIVLKEILKDRNSSVNLTEKINKWKKISAPNLQLQTAAHECFQTRRATQLTMKKFYKKKRFHFSKKEFCGIFIPKSHWSSYSPPGTASRIKEGWIIWSTTCLSQQNKNVPDRNLTSCLHLPLLVPLWRLACLRLWAPENVLVLEMEETGFFTTENENNRRWIWRETAQRKLKGNHSSPDQNRNLLWLSLSYCKNSSHWLKVFSAMSFLNLLVLTSCTKGSGFGALDGPWPSGTIGALKSATDIFRCYSKTFEMIGTHVQE